MEISSGQPVFVGNGGYGNGCGLGGDNGVLFLAFLAMMGGWGGFGGGRGGYGPNVPNNIATTDTVNQAVQFEQLQNQNQAIMAEVQRSNNAALMFGADKYSELQRDIANNGMALQSVLAQLNQCCCSIKQEISAVVLDTTKQNYEMRIHMDEQFCALNNRMTEQENQRLRDKVDNLQDDMRMMRMMLGLRNGGCGCSNGFNTGNLNALAAGF